MTERFVLTIALTVFVLVFSAATVAQAPPGAGGRGGELEDPVHGKNAYVPKLPVLEKVFAHRDELRLTDEQSRQIDALYTNFEAAAGHYYRQAIKAAKKLGRLSKEENPDLVQVDAVLKEMADWWVKSRFNFFESASKVRIALTPEQREIISRPEK